MSRDYWDVYAQKAKKEGYPARSVYKLAQIHEKYRLFGAHSRILDLGCAPGSWSFYALKQLKGEGGFLVGVDLEPVNIPYNPLKATFLQGDLCEIKDKLSQWGPYDAVLSDAAPKTTGNRLVDTARSFSLAETVIEIALKDLKKGGNLLVKVFQGGEERQLEFSLKKYFNMFRKVKPKAVRCESFEVYLLAMGFKG